MTPGAITLDFFHDVVCGWCFVMSPRLRQVARELDITVRHRSFVLQESREQMVQAFGSMPLAKSQILGHWSACAQHDDQDRIDIEGMRAESFEYPNGMLGALACKAAEALAGQTGHWDMFDAIQVAHLSDHRNIGDADVLLDIASGCGFDRDTFAQRMRHADVFADVQADRALARSMEIRSIPTLVVLPGGMRLPTLSVDALRATLLPLTQTTVTI